MLVPFLAIIDRMIDLLGRRAESNRRLFQDQVEPIFDDVIHIHGDYLSMFREALDLVSDDSVPFENIAALLRERRVHLLAVREKVSVLSGAIRSNADLHPMARQFFEQVSWYFHATSGGKSMVHGGSATSSLLDAIDLIDFWSKDRRDRVRWNIVEAEGKLREGWDGLLEAYAAARVQLLA